jgi:hypothetical protein
MYAMNACLFAVVQGVFLRQKLDGAEAEGNAANGNV